MYIRLQQSSLTVLLIAVNYFRVEIINHNASCLVKECLNNYCFQFLLDISVVPRQVEENGYSRF